MSTAQRVIKNTVWLYVRMAASIFVNIFTTRILLQALGASDYGLYNVVGGAIAMLGFLTSSMSTATQRFISYAQGEGRQERVKEIFNNAQIVHYGLAAITVVLLTVAAFIFFNGVLNIPSGREMVARGVYACVVFSTVFSITIVPYDATLNAHENMRFYSIAGIFDVIFKFLIAIIVLYVDGERLLLYAILMALESWLLRLITKYYCTRHYEECRRPELRKYFSRDAVRQLTSFAGWNLANIATSMFALYGINVLINSFFGTQMNAAYGVAIQLSGALMAVSANMVKAIVPVLTKKEACHERRYVIDISCKGCRFSFMLFAFFCIPFFFFIEPILQLWLHDVPDWTAQFCCLVLISSLIEQLVAVLYHAISAQGDVKEFNIALIIPNLLAFFVTLIMYQNDFSPLWGVINWIIFRQVIGGAIKVYYSHKKVGLSVKYFFMEVIYPALIITVASILLGFVVISVCENIQCHWLISILIYFLLNILIYWFIGIDKSEKAMIKGAIKKII